MDGLVEYVGRAAERPYDIPLNVAIWIAFKPIIKIYLSIGAGFFLVKFRILTPELSKGISRLVLLIFMPCLIFNNIVTQIKDTEIKLFGVIVFTGFIYYVIGLGWGFIIWLISPIPRGWFGGLLLCCMINNCSDLPLAYVQTIGKSPFLPSDSAAKGQSYCVLIVIIFTIFTFNLGGTRMIEWDFTRNDPRAAEPTVPLISWESSKRFFRHITGRETAADREIELEHKEEKLKEKEEKEEAERLKKEESNSDNSLDAPKSSDLEAQSSPSGSQAVVPYYGESQNDSNQNTHPQNNQSPVTRAQSERHFGSTEVYYSNRRYTESIPDAEGFSDAHSSLAPPASHSPAAFDNLSRRMSQTNEQKPVVAAPKKLNPFSRGWKWFKRKWFHFKEKNKVTRYICNFCEDIFLPQMLALLAGITVCMIPWVRRVFVKGQNIKHFHDAPDKNPPLDFLMDFLAFFAGAQVPLGLMLLGGTMASLKVGKMVKGFWKTLVLIVLFKLAILPIIACGWIHRIREIGWIDKDDAMTPIVLSVASGTPSATVQIYLTLAWIDPTKESPVLNCLAIALMAQYVLLPLSMTILMTFIIMHYV